MRILIDECIDSSLRNPSSCHVYDVPQAIFFRKEVVLTTSTQATVKKLNINHGTGMCEVETYARECNNAVSLYNLRLQASGFCIRIRGRVHGLKFPLRSQDVLVFERQIRRKGPANEIFYQVAGSSAEGNCELSPMKSRHAERCTRPCVRS